MLVQLQLHLDKTNINNSILREPTVPLWSLPQIETNYVNQRVKIISKIIYCLREGILRETSVSLKLKPIMLTGVLR